MIATDQMITFEDLSAILGGDERVADVFDSIPALAGWSDDGSALGAFGFLPAAAAAERSER